jgi:hypothetical protein
VTLAPGRPLILGLLLVSFGLLAPGLFQPVLSIRGVLTRDGVASVAPQLLERGITDETINALTSLMNPMAVVMLQATGGGDLRKAILARLTPQVTAALQKGIGDVEVYTQTRSIVGSVRRLYQVGSWLPASLILLFSIIVPVGKGILVASATFMTNVARRQRVLEFVELIAKWSMADVFVVALFIAYLAAMASQAAPGQATALVAFKATFGVGFYWFAAYCVFSLASQQYTLRAMRHLRTGASSSGDGARVSDGPL